MSKSIRKFFFLVLTLSLVYSCHSSRYSLPNFKYNSKIKNGWIVNRLPDYGDGHRDGCIIMGELSVSLVEENGKVIGQVFDATNDESMPYVQIVVNWGFENEVQTLVDSEGRFSFEKIEKLKNITFSSVGYRTLEVNFPAK